MKFQFNQFITELLSNLLKVITSLQRLIKIEFKSYEGS